MYETVVCPSCRRLLRLAPDHMGKKVQCPTCETMFIAGETTPPLQAPVPDAVTAKRSSASPRPIDDDDRPRRRRSRRLDTNKPSAGRKPWQTVMIIGIAITVGGGFMLLPVIVAVLERGNRIPVLPPMANFAQPNNFMVAPPPPPIDVPDRLLTAEEQQTHAKTFFDHFSAVMRNPMDQAGESACFDVAKLLDSAFAQKFIPADRQGDRARLLSEFQNGIFQSNIYHGQDWWTNFDIKTVKNPRSRELIAVTRHANRANGSVLRLRWWLAHRDGRWRITEMEDLDYGLRLSMMIAGSLQPAEPAVRTLREAGNAIIMRTNFDEADRILATVRVDAMPKACAATHQLLIASIRIRQRRFEDTIAACTAAERFDPDMPGNNYLFAISYNTLRRDPLALKHARAAHAWLGDDPVICYELGLAFNNQSRFAEAVPLYRKALDGQPNHKEAFINLLRCIVPGSKNDDIGPRFLKLQNPENHFLEFAKDCWLARDTSTVKSLAEAMLMRLPRHADAHFYLALVHADEERLPAALASFKTALECQDLDARREIYFSEFARNVVLRDQALPAYHGLPDRQRAFRALGEELRLAFKLDDLQELVDLHAKNQPKDPYVLLFRADLHLRDEQYALADRNFTMAIAAINDPVVTERYRNNRIRARYELGDVLGAYRDIGPQRMAFQQLADSCWFDKKTAELKKLVDVHAENDAFDTQLPRNRWRLALHDKQLDVATKAFRASHDQAIGVDAKRHVMQDFLFDANDAGQALEGYRRAGDPHLALEIIAANFWGNSNLDAVLAEHRKGFPNDPVVKMYAGQQAEKKQDWAKAAAAYSEGWPQLPDAKRQRWTYPYLFACFKTGQAVQAYRDSGKRPEQFRQLTAMLLGDKQIDAFEQLLAVHRPHRAIDPEFAAYEARLKILRGKSAEAAELLLGLLKDRPLNDQQRIGDSFLADLARFDLAAEAYLCIPDKRDAFSHMVWTYRQPERVKEYARLIAEHAKQHPDDPRLAIERAELDILQGNFALAEQKFVLARLNNPNDFAARTGLIRACIKLGKAADTYRELGANARAFLDIANQCVTMKDGVQLAQTLAAHRQAHAAAKNLAVWDLEVHWQKKDYEAAVKALQADRGGLLKNSNWRWKCEGYLVRGLVRMKKAKEAVHEAETITQRKDGSQVLLALALASTGDVPRFLEFMETKKNQHFFVEDCYRDEDLGPLLRSDAFRAVQERYPPPPMVPLPNGGFDDGWD
jgi:LSD1 subclass zinc finger protein